MGIKPFHFIFNWSLASETMAIAFCVCMWGEGGYGWLRNTCMWNDDSSLKSQVVISQGTSDGGRWLISEHVSCWAIPSYIKLLRDIKIKNIFLLSVIFTVNLFNWVLIILLFTNNTHMYLKSYRNRTIFFGIIY